MGDNYKIDASQYFKNIEPAQVSNVLKNFYQELADGRRRFKDILMKKYHNILQCKDNFQEMIDACDKAQSNISVMHETMNSLNFDYLGQIQQKILDIDTRNTQLEHRVPQEEQSIQVSGNQQLQILICQLSECELKNQVDNNLREKIRYLEQRLLRIGLIDVVNKYLDEGDQVQQIEGRQSIEFTLESLFFTVVYFYKNSQLYQHLMQFIRRSFKISIKDHIYSESMDSLYSFIVHLTFEILNLKLQRSIANVQNQDQNQLDFDQILRLINDYIIVLQFLSVKVIKKENQESQSHRLRAKFIQVTLSQLDNIQNRGINEKIQNSSNSNLVRALTFELTFDQADFDKILQERIESFLETLQNQIKQQMLKSFNNANSQTTTSNLFKNVKSIIKVLQQLDESIKQKSNKQKILSVTCQKIHSQLLDTLLTLLTNHLKSYEDILNEVAKIIQDNEHLEKLDVKQGGLVKGKNLSILNQRFKRRGLSCLHCQSL
ncbi:UNKNOWN [Stylonychia lemnae]|uniref:Uncharacterized protein n=1 Tax=Stylonychia lemnae TaxID=5949 RepID=A0A078AYU7_STYLE|nr:UNKNOWN [Stylonychia lemnae]|eukprot:CDW87615.1 UNKNOWN [Stylonychia lemnae]